jgi:uncharacterized membrane protein
MSLSLRTRRVVQLVLAISLAVNLFGIAFVGARLWHNHTVRGALIEADGGTAAPPVRTILRQIIASLPAKDGVILREAFIARLPELAALNRASIGAAEQVRIDIAQQPFDFAKTQADMLVSRDARQKTGAAVQETLLGVLPKMSDEGRRALAHYRLGASK